LKTHSILRLSAKDLRREMPNGGYWEDEEEEGEEEARGEECINVLFETLSCFWAP
jgi:hypothetical protein